MGLDAGHQNEKVENANAAFRSLGGVERRVAASPDRIAREVSNLAAVSQFVQKNLPAIPAEAKTGREGFYSPAHSLAYSLKYAEGLASDGPKFLNRFRTTLDQSKRLLSYASHEKSVRVHGLSGAVREEEHRVPYLVEVPEKWKQGPAGQEFQNVLRDFIVRRHNQEPLGKNDLDAVNRLVELISSAYEGVSEDKERAEHAPYARELIMIDLALLAKRVRGEDGVPMSFDEDAQNLIQLVRGLYNYTERKEIEQRSTPARFQDAPALVEQPAALRT